MYRQRKMFMTLRGAVVFMQRLVRSRIRRTKIRQQQESAARIQACWRGAVDRRRCVDLSQCQDCMRIDVFAVSDVHAMVKAWPHVYTQ